MSSFRSLVFIIVGLTAATSLLLQRVLPPALGPLRLYLIFFKVLVVCLWLFFAWRAYRYKEEMRSRKEEEGTLWEGDLTRVKTNLKLKHFEAIRYHFDKDEQLVVVDRRHWYYLDATLYCFTFVFACLIGALWLSVVHPDVQFTIRTILHAWKLKHPIRAHFSIWWVPILPAIFFFYEGLQRWQTWKWQEIRALTNKYLYILSEQPTFMPWLKSDITVIEIRDMIPAETEAKRGQESLMRYGTARLRRKFGEDPHRAELVELDFVPDFQEFYALLRQVRQDALSKDATVEVAPQEYQPNLAEQYQKVSAAQPEQLSFEDTE
jgi:hypothetical protein